MKFLNNKNVELFLWVFVLIGTIFNTMSGVAQDFLELIGGAGVVSVVVPVVFAEFVAVSAIFVAALLFLLELNNLFSALSQKTDVPINSGVNAQAEPSKVVGGVGGWMRAHPVCASGLKIFLLANTVALNLAFVAGLNVSVLYATVMFPVFSIIVTGVLMADKIKSYGSVAVFGVFVSMVSAVVGVVFSLSFFLVLMSAFAFKLTDRFDTLFVRFESFSSQYKSGVTETFADVADVAADVRSVGGFGCD